MNPSLLVSVDAIMGKPMKEENTVDAVHTSDATLAWQPAQLSFVHRISFELP